MPIPSCASPICSAGVTADGLTTSCRGVARRVIGRPQIATDGHQPYLEAIESAFGADVDFATLQKIYGTSDEPAKRYRPPKCIGVECKVIIGDPNPKHVSTSYVERQNLTMRTSMRRFTRLTNGFSKKFENLAYSVALHFMHYNFCRIHKTLRVTPAMEAAFRVTYGPSRKFLAFWIVRLSLLRENESLPEAAGAGHGGAEEPSTERRDAGVSGCRGLWIGI